MSTPPVSTTRATAPSKTGTRTSRSRSRLPLVPILPKGKRKRGRPRSNSAPAAIGLEKQGKKRKLWTNEAMEAAMRSVLDENTPISRAARNHGVPKSTLHDRISGNVTHGDKSGPKQLLSPVEEAEFSEFLIEVAQAGYGKTSKEIRQIAGRVAVDKGRKRHLMYHMDGFTDFCKDSHSCLIGRVILRLMCE